MIWDSLFLFKKHLRKYIHIVYATSPVLLLNNKDDYCFSHVEIDFFLAKVEIIIFQ